MWEALLLGCCLLQLVTFGLIVWVGSEYIRVRRWACHITCCMRHFVSVTPIARIMQMDELIDELLEADTQAGQPVIAATIGCSAATDVVASLSPPPGRQVDAHRERLAALAAGGQARQYLGKGLSADQIDSLDEDEVEKLYARYEARLGARMVKTLGQAALQLYAGAASMFLPIPQENQPALVADLETDPFVGHALSSATCELYHRYGMFLAPLTAAITTARHCQFGHRCPRTIDEDGEDGRTEPTSDAGGKSDNSGAGDD